jgi:hypothetical protein
MNDFHLIGRGNIVVKGAFCNYVDKMRWVDHVVMSSS